MNWDIFVYDGDPTDGIGGPCISENEDVPASDLPALLAEFRSRMETGLVDSEGQTWSQDCTIILRPTTED